MRGVGGADQPAELGDQRRGAHRLRPARLDRLDVHRQHVALLRALDRDRPVLRVDERHVEHLRRQVLLGLDRALERVVRLGLDQVAGPDAQHRLGVGAVDVVVLALHGLGQAVQFAGPRPWPRPAAPCRRSRASSSLASSARVRALHRGPARASSGAAARRPSGPAPTPCSCGSPASPRADLRRSIRASAPSPRTARTARLRRPSPSAGPSCARPWSSAMVWAGMSSTHRRAAAALLSGWAVISRFVAPASPATPISASAVEISPGPEVTRNTSPGPSAGVVMSPTTATGRPRWKSRIAKPFDLQRLAPAAIDADPAARRRCAAGCVDGLVVQPLRRPAQARPGPCRRGCASAACS